MKTGFAPTSGITNINRTGLALRSRGVRRRIAIKGLAIASITLLSAATVPGAPASSYVQDGLIACWDGIENAGPGIHDSSATVWKDLVAGREFSLHNVTVGADRMTFAGAATSYGNLSATDTTATFVAATNGTMEIVYAASVSLSDTRVIMQSPGTSGFCFSIKPSRITGANASGKMFSFTSGTATNSASIRYDKGLPESAICNGASVSASGTDNWNVSGSETVIGTRAAKSGYHFPGSIYCIRLYNRRLTDEEIAANHNVDALRFILGDPAVLRVTGSPSDIGSPSPAYGETNGLAAGESFTVSCGATSVTNVTLAVCTGWKLYDWNGAIVSSGAETSFTYTHPTPAEYRRLEWQWAETAAVFSPCVAYDEEVVLSADTTINVPAGQTNHIEFLLGGSHKITKTGAGRLEIGIVTNNSVMFDVQAGTLAFTNPRTITLTNTVMHLDASLASSLVTTSAGGTNFVTRWNDADGGSRYATTRSGRPNPYVAEKRADGIDMVDFGSLWSDADCNEDGDDAARYTTVLQSGYGAAMDFSSAVSGTWEYFWVAQDWSNIRNLISGSQTAITGPTVLGHYMNQAARGLGCNGTLPTLLSQKVSSTGWYWNYLINATTGSTWSGILPEARVNVVNHSIGSSAVQSLDSLAYATTAGFGPYQSDGETGRTTCGGLRIGEVYLFNRKLSGQERALLNWALVRKWRGMSAGAVTVASGATLALAGHGTTASSVTIADGGRLELALDPGFSDSSFTSATALTLSGGGTLVVDASAIRPADFGDGKRAFSLIRSANVTGAADGWSVETTGANLDLAGKFAVDGVGLRVTLEKAKALTVIFR